MCACALVSSPYNARVSLVPHPSTRSPLQPPTQPKRSHNCRGFRGARRSLARRVCAQFGWAPTRTTGDSVRAHNGKSHRCQNRIGRSPHRQQRQHRTGERDSPSISIVAHMWCVFRRHHRSQNTTPPRKDVITFHRKTRQLNESSFRWF